MTKLSSLRIEWEWEAAPTIRAPELRATFARLRILIGNDCITLVEDQESGSSRRAVAVSLYPLAEWLAYNWWFLCAESRHATNLDFVGMSYDPLLSKRLYHRHDIRSAGDGFLWPDLLVLPEGDFTNLVWRPDRVAVAHRPIRYLTHGQAIVDSGELQQALGGLIQAVLDRLSDCEVGQTQLAEEWEAIQRADPDEVEYCLAAARLGLDPYSEASNYESEILEAGSSLSVDLLRDFLDVVDPARISSGLRWISQARSEIETIAGPDIRIEDDLVRKLSADQSIILPESPWHAGYGAARAFRDAFDLRPSDKFEVESYVGNKVVSSSAEPSMHAFGSAVVQGPSLILGRLQGPHSRRFTLARGMWNLIRRPGEQFLVTTGHTLRQKAERAFAAELLAPAEGVASMLSADVGSITDDEIERVGEHFDVSPLVVKHQIDNQLVDSFSAEGCR